MLLVLLVVLLLRTLRDRAHGRDRGENRRFTQRRLARNAVLALVPLCGLPSKGRTEVLENLGNDRVDVHILVVLAWEFHIGHHCG